MIICGLKYFCKLLPSSFKKCRIAELMTVFEMQLTSTFHECVIILEFYYLMHVLNRLVSNSILNVLSEIYSHFMFICPQIHKCLHQRQKKNTEKCPKRLDNFFHGTPNY